MKLNNFQQTSSKCFKISSLIFTLFFSFLHTVNASSKSTSTHYHKIPVGTIVAIKATNNKYISSENGRKFVTSNRSRIGAWEKFKVVNAGNGMISLKGSNGRYISSEYGKKPMTCNRKNIGWGEKFYIIKLKNGRYALKGSNRRFISSENGKKPLSCNRRNIGTWEMFSIKILKNTPIYTPNIITNAGKINRTQVNCGAFQPNKLIGTTAKTSKGHAPVYQWQVKTNKDGSWQNIQGANTVHYTPKFANIGSKWYRRAARASKSNKYLYSNVVDIHARETPTANVHVTNIDCFTDKGKITLNFQDSETRLYLQFSIDNGAHFIWVSDKVGSYTFDDLPEGEYQIITKWGDNDCPVSLGTHRIENNKINLEILNSESNSICSGQTTTLTANSNGAILWSTGATTPSIEVSPNDTTTYGVTAKKGNCSLSEEIIVTVSNPTISIENQEICKGDSATLTAIGQGTVLWSTGETTQSIAVSPNKTTNYTVTLTNEQGCTATAEASVVVNTADVKIDGPTDINICLGEEVIITATEADTYAWSTGETTQSITVSPTEDAWIFLNSTVNGCNAIRQVVEILVEDSLKDVTINSDITINKGESAQLTATGGDTYLWNDGDTNSTKVVAPTETTTYAVNITKNNCSSSYNTTVNVTAPTDPCTKEVYNVTAFPNPISNVGDLTVHISVQEAQSVSYAFYKTDGNKIGPSKEILLNKGCNEIPINLGTHCNFIPSENYFLIVNAKDWTKNIQIITLPN